MVPTNGKARRPAMALHCDSTVLPFVEGVQFVPSSELYIGFPPVNIPPATQRSPVQAKAVHVPDTPVA